MKTIQETKPRKSSGKSKNVVENPIAYTIEDKKFGKFDVLNSANAWWLERAKVELLIAACKIDASVEECCSWAGISEDQYKYFREQHEWFSPLKKLCNEMPSIRARNAVVAGLEDVNNARWYLEKKRKKEFGNAIDLTTDGKPLPTPIYAGVLDTIPIQGHDGNQKDI